VINKEIVVFQIEDMLSNINKENLLSFGGHIDNGEAFLELMTNVLTLLKEHKAKTGTWQWKIHGKPESGGTLGEAVCDQCGKSTYTTAVKGNLNYCPNCGAKMTEGR